MARPTTLIVGCGYLGRRVGRLLSRRGGRVFGTTRRPDRAGALADWGVEAILADVLDPESLDRLPEADRALFCVGFDRSAGVPVRDVYVDGLRHTLGRLVDRVGFLVHASSTGVYGDLDGDWIDEDSPTGPRTESGLACLEAEGVVRQYEREGPLPATILRFAGLYGPGRLMRREAILKGEPIVADPDNFLNLIHIDDAASVTVAALDRGEPNGLYLVADDRPAPRSEFYARAAEILSAPPPRFLPPEPGSPEARGRGSTNKRVSNRRMRLALSVTLAYPDIATGVPAALKTGD